MHEIESRVRAIADYPRPGVVFRDLSPLLADPKGLALCIDALADPWRHARLDAVCGIESRGFIFGAATAHALGCGFVPLRKAGKLPPPTYGVDYELEYGIARLEIAKQALPVGARVLVVDDVLATGGTLEAARCLLEQVQADVVGGAVVVEIEPLAGRARWQGTSPLRALVRY